MTVTPDFAERLAREFPGHDTLQDSHNALARILAELVDQVMRGTHGITVLQELHALQALHGCLPHTGTGRAGHLTRGALIDLMERLCRPGVEIVAGKDAT